MDLRQSVLREFHFNMYWDYALVVGYGSIGKRHVTQLETISKKILIVDPQNLQHGIPSNSKSVQTLEQVPLNRSGKSVAVISNWGPSHLKTLTELAEMGFRNLILEKPMTTSLEELFELRKIKEIFGLNILVNQGWNYSDFYSLISTLQNTYSLGSPIAIWSVGGARCISTAGSHIVHLATRLFDSPALSFTASLNFQRINPRSDSLDYVDGTASIEYGTGEKLGLNFTNQSSLEGMTFIYWRNHVAEVHATGQFKLKSNLNLVASTDKITRYAPSGTTLYDTENQEIPVRIDNMDSIHAVSLDSFASTSRIDFANHCTSAFNLLMIMNAGVEKRTLYPKDADKKLIFERKFSIS